MKKLLVSAALALTLAATAGISASAACVPAYGCRIPHGLCGRPMGQNRCVPCVDRNENELCVGQGICLEQGCQFIDENNDGVCDNHGTENCGGNSYGRGTGAQTGTAAGNAVGSGHHGGRHGGHHGRHC